MDAFIAGIAERIAHSNEVGWLVDCIVLHPLAQRKIDAALVDPCVFCAYEVRHTRYGFVSELFGVPLRFDVRIPEGSVWLCLSKEERMVA